MPFVSFGKTGDQVTRIDVALSVIACKLCGYPDGTKRKRERERESCYIKALPSYHVLSSEDVYAVMIKLV